MSKVISSYKGLRAGLQVFALLMLFLCVILHTMWSDVFDSIHVDLQYDEISLTWLCMCRCIVSIVMWSYLVCL